jgi:hypothetical protein
MRLLGIDRVHQSSQAALPLSEEKRRFQRVRVNILGRYMLPNKHEYPCQVVNMSPGGAKIVAPAIGQIGERVIAYLDHVGRIEGRITRVFEGGFAMSINATKHKQDKLAAQLTWLANRQELDLPEDRRHDRISPRNPFSNIVLPDEDSYPCRVIDMSLSGAGVAAEICPAIGTPVTLGRIRGRVVRHFEGGFALEFSTPQTRESLAAQFGALD